jgi:hypothetical protein
VTPGELYKRIARRLDLDPSAYLQDPEVGQLCEEAYLDLWDLLISSLGDEAPWERVTLTTTPNSDVVSTTLAQGCYRMLRLEFKGNGQTWRPLSRLSLTADDVDDRARDWASSQGVRFFARRDVRATESARSGVAQSLTTWKFYFSPVPSAAYALRLYYVPPPPITLTWAADVPTYSLFPDEFPEYVVEWVAAKLAAKQETDPAPFLAGLAHQKDLIERYSKPHVLNVPQFLPDLRAQQPDMGERDGFWDRRG